MSDQNSVFNASQYHATLIKIADADRAARSVENKKQRDFDAIEYQKDRDAEDERARLGRINPKSMWNSTG